MSGAAGPAENAPQVPSPIHHPLTGVPNTAKMILVGTVLALFFSGTFWDLLKPKERKRPSLCLVCVRFDSQVEDGERQLTCLSFCSVSFIGFINLYYSVLKFL